MEVVQQGSTVVSSTVPIVDPATGALTTEWTIHHIREVQRIEGGYDAQGREVHILEELGPIGDPLVESVNTTRRTVTVGDDFTRYDANLRVTPNELDYEPTEPTLALHGQSVVQITDGLVIPAAAVDSMMRGHPAGPIRSASASAARVRRVSPGLVRVEGRVPEWAGRRGGAAETARTYRRKGADYLLERVEMISTRSDTAGNRVETVMVQDIELQLLHQNRGRDRIRRTSGTATLSSELVLDPSLEPCRSSHDNPDECEPEPNDPPPPPADTCGQVLNGVDVTFVHGIFSEGETWGRMEEWVSCGFLTNRIQTPDVPWMRAITEQRDSLRLKVPTLLDDMIVIGHSNGGLVSRAFAQWAQQQRPGYVQGVIHPRQPQPRRPHRVLGGSAGGRAAHPSPGSPRSPVRRLLGSTSVLRGRCTPERLPGRHQ